MKQIKPLNYAYRVHWINGDIDTIWGNDSIDDLLKPRWNKCERIPACGFEPIDKLSVEDKRIYEDMDVIWNPDFCKQLKESVLSGCEIGSIVEIKVGRHSFKFEYVGSTDLDIQYKKVQN